MNEDSLLISPREYFRGKITKASDNLSVYLGSEMEVYLVNMLCDFISADKVSEDCGKDVLNTPVAFLLQEAQESPCPDSKIRIFRRLGDTTLYIAGYFQDYFNRKTFDISYYIDIGAIAYTSVSKLIRKRGESIRVYDDLAENFSQIVDVVAEASDEPATRQDNRNLLAIYDRWTKSQSRRLARILEEEGIAPVPVNNSKLAQ